MRFLKKLKRMLQRDFLQPLMEEMACRLAYDVFRQGDPARTLRRLLMVHHSVVERGPRPRFVWRKEARDALMYVLAYSGELDEQDMIALVEEEQSKGEFEAFWSALHLKVQGDFEDEDEDGLDFHESTPTDDRAP